MDDHHVEKNNITCEEIQEAFNRIDSILNRRIVWDQSPEALNEVVEFYNAMSQFESRYQKTLQNYYKLVRQIESGQQRNPVNLFKEKSKLHCFEAYEAATRLLKSIKLVRQRWRKEIKNF